MSIIQYLEDGRTNDPKSLHSTVYTELLEDILTGKLIPGAKITEQKICSEYNVSRTPVRGAFCQLETDGLIESIPNRGAFVIGLSDRDIDDILELRTSCEVCAVKWAIERITEEEFAELEESFEFMEFYTMKNDIDKMISINAAFHQIIHNATHNAGLIKQLTSYQTYLKYCRPSDYTIPGYLDKVFSEHREIYRAFVDSDTTAGAIAMMDHMNNSVRRRTLLKGKREKSIR